MKKFILACTFFLATLFLIAQSWNPYVSQGIISPAPLIQGQLNGTGVVSFNIGNTGSSPLVYDPDSSGNNMILVISLSRGLPNVNPLDPKTASTTIGGTWAKMFTWVYDLTLNTFTGVQNQTIPGQSQGSVEIQYKITQDSQKTQPKNGFKVNLVPPPYTQSKNSANDDVVSCYTWTEARDSGDTPK